MATASGAFSSYPSLLSLRAECYIIQSDPANNRSLVRADAYIDFSGNSATSYNNTVNLSINGTGGSWNIGTQSYSGAGARLVVSGFDVWVGHDTNGYLGSIAFGVSASTGGWGSASGSNSLGGFTDYDRRPGSPSISTSRTLRDVSVTLGAVSSPAGTATYYCQRSENGGAYGDTKTGQTPSYTNLTAGSTQQFRSYASNSDGTSGYTYSTAVTIPTVPSAPALINVTSVAGLDMTVGISTSASNGGEPITGYTMEYNNGSGWTGSTPVVGNSVTYTNLTPGLNYQFRAYATNAIGNSAYATSATVFLSAGGRRWTGSAWIPTATAKRWTGTAWVPLTTAKRWNGSTWVNLS